MVKWVEQSQESSSGVAEVTRQNHFGHVLLQEYSPLYVYTLDIPFLLHPPPSLLHAPSLLKMAGIRGAPFEE